MHAKVIEIKSAKARAMAVAKFRELADRLERGELRGARVQWREGASHIETVELRHDEVELLRFETGDTDGE